MQALADYRQILQLDPQNPNVVRDLLYTYCAHARLAQCREDLPNAFLRSTPDSLNAKAQIGYVDFWKTGSTARLKSEMASIPPGKDPDGAVTAFRLDASLIDRDPAVAERILGGLTARFFPISTMSTLREVFLAGEIAFLRGDEKKARC